MVTILSVFYAGDEHKMIEEDEGLKVKCVDRRIRPPAEIKKEVRMIRFNSSFPIDIIRCFFYIKGSIFKQNFHGERRRTMPEWWNW